MKRSILVLLVLIFASVANAEQNPYVHPGTLPPGVTPDGQSGITVQGNVGAGSLSIGTTALNGTADKLTNPSIQTGYLSTTKVVGTGGIAQYTLVKLATDASVVTAATIDGTSSGVGVLGVAVSTRSTATSVEVATRGAIFCVADNATTIGHLAIVGTTTAGTCRDSGQTSSTAIPIGTQVIGKFLTAVPGGANASLQFYGPGHYGAQTSLLAPLASPLLTDSPTSQATLNGYSVPRVLCQSTTPISLYSASGWASAPTNQYIMASCTVPAGAMGLNGALRVSAIYSNYVTASTKTDYLYLGGTQIWQAGLAGSNAGAVIYYIIANRNSASSQVSLPQYATGSGTSNNPIVTASVNTASSTTVNFQGRTSAEAGVSQTSLTGDGTTCTATVASGAYNTGDEIIVGSGTGCGSGSQNVGPTPVTATNISTTQYSYPCTCNGGTPTSGSGQRYSVVQLEYYLVELIPGVN